MTDLATHPMAITPHFLREWPLPTPEGSKYARGQVLVIGGAVATPGAAMLAGEAALRMGAGRLSLAVAADIAPQVAVTVRECGTVALATDDAGSITGQGAGSALERELTRADAVLVGPGIDDATGCIRLLGEIAPLLGDDTPVVLDAFGATVLPDLPREVRDRLAGRIVLTPNSNELRRVAQADSLDDDEAVLAACLSVTKDLDAVVACDAWVVHAGQVWHSTTGDTGLGTSGSGDVMAGAVVGLLSRGAEPHQAACWAKHVHASAGDALAAQFGRIGYLAGELLPELPRQLQALRGM